MTATPAAPARTVHLGAGVIGIALFPVRALVAFGHASIGVSRLVKPGGVVDQLLEHGGPLERLLAQEGAIERVLAPGGALDRLLDQDGLIEQLMADDGVIERPNARRRKAKPEPIAAAPEHDLEVTAPLF